MPSCVKPLTWRPERVALSEPAETEIALPWHGFPAVLVGHPASPADARIALIDTGATFSLVSPRFVQESHLDVSQSSIRISDIFGNIRSRVRIARVEHLIVGNASLNGFDAVIDDTAMLSGLSDKLDFLLAGVLFSDVLMTIDYPQEKLILRNGSLPEPNGKTILPLRRDPQGHFSLPTRMLGEEAWLVVDTGDTVNGIYLSRYRLIGMPWASTPISGGSARGVLGNAPSRMGRMNGNVTIGQYTIRRPIIGIAATDNIEILGADVLHHFKVTVDQRNNRIQLLAPTTRPVEVPPMRQIGFGVAPPSAVITVMPGSEAERAGLKNGDQLLSINEIQPTQVSNKFVESLEASPAPMRLRIKRADQEMVLSVPVTTLIP